MSRPVKFSGYLALNRVLLVGSRALWRRDDRQPPVLPRNSRDLARWLSEEETRRERLDSAVLGWLSHYRWPADLDNMDRWLLTERLFYAIHWLRVASSLPEEMRPDTHPKLLEVLLIDVWSRIFLGQYGGKLQH